MSVPIKVLWVDTFAISSGNIGDRDNPWEIQSATIGTTGCSGLEVSTGGDDVHDEFIPVALELWNEGVICLDPTIDSRKVVTEGRDPFGLKVG